MLHRAVSSLPETDIPTGTLEHPLDPVFTRISPEVTRNPVSRVLGDRMCPFLRATSLSHRKTTLLPHYSLGTLGSGGSLFPTPPGGRRRTKGCPVVQPKAGMTWQPLHQWQYRLI